MNRFFVESFKEDFSIFKSEPIYLIFEQNYKGCRQVGKGFNSYNEAEFICDWLNQADGELNDLIDAGVYE